MVLLYLTKCWTCLLNKVYHGIYFGTGRGHSGYGRNIRKTTKYGFTNVLINVILDVEPAVQRNSLRSRRLGRSIIESIKSTLNQPIKVEKTTHDLIYI